MVSLPALPESEFVPVLPVSSRLSLPLPPKEVLLP